MIHTVESKFIDSSCKIIAKVLAFDVIALDPLDTITLLPVEETLQTIELPLSSLIYSSESLVTF